MDKDNDSNNLPLNRFTEKAGMKDINKHKIEKIIYEASKNTDFYRHEQQKTEQVQKKVRSMKNDIQKNILKGPKFIKETNDEIEKKIRDLEKERVLTETWIHVDMDMFYASVEIRDNPELADYPLAVGDLQMITTTNYVARRYGVRGAMPGFIGQKLCPDLIFIAPNFSKYHIEGEKIREIFKEYDHNFESMGLDEANLWVTPVLNERGINNHQGRQNLATEIRERIFATTQLTASAGIACNKLLAKMATEMNKPNGQFYVTPERVAIIEFIEKQKVRKVPGIGKVLEKILNELGVNLCADIFKKKLEISFVFNESSFSFLVRSALGLGSTHHTQKSDDQKTISFSKSFPPTANTKDLENKLNEFCEQLAKELSEKDAECKNITVYAKTSSYETLNRSETSRHFIFIQDDIAKLALKQLESLYPLQQPIRMLGLRAGTLAFGKKSRKTIQGCMEENKEKAPIKKSKKENEEFENSFLKNSVRPEKKTIEDSKPTSSGIKMMRLQCPICTQ